MTNDFWMPVFAARRKKKCGKVVINANRFPKGQYGLYGGVDLVAAASGAVAQAIKQQTPKLSSKVKVFPNAIDEAFFEPRKGDRRWEIENRGAEDGGRRTEGKAQLTVLYVGRIHPEKGVEILLEAWKCLVEIRIRMRIRTDVRLKLLDLGGRSRGIS